MSVCVYSLTPPHITPPHLIPHHPTSHHTITPPHHTTSHHTTSRHITTPHTSPPHLTPHCQILYHTTHLKTLRESHNPKDHQTLLIPTTIIPASHCYEVDSRWITKYDFLSSLFNYIYSFFIYFFFIDFLFSFMYLGVHRQSTSGQCDASITECGYRICRA